MPATTIFTAFQYTDAELVRARLEIAGFHPIVTNENTAVNLGGFSKATMIQVQVPEDEVAEARAFINSPAE